MTTLVAKAGSIAVCSNGHELCELSADLHLGDINWAQKFVNWRQAEPAVGQPTVLCAICGEPLFGGRSPLFMPSPKKPQPV